MRKYKVMFFLQGRFNVEVFASSKKEAVVFAKKRLIENYHFNQEEVEVECFVFEN